jgi:hypothetical protein
MLLHIKQKVGSDPQIILLFRFGEIPAGIRLACRSIRLDKKGGHNVIYLWIRSLLYTPVYPAEEMSHGRLD